MFHVLLLLKKSLSAVDRTSIGRTSRAACEAAPPLIVARGQRSVQGEGGKQFLPGEMPEVI